MATIKVDLGSVVGPAGPAGKDGPKGDNGVPGERGETGAAGKNATINGQETITIEGTSPISVTTTESTLTIKADTYTKAQLTNYDHIPNGAGPHNAIYRGIQLGTSFTEEHSKVIKDGTFKGMFIGDYWTISGTVYRIAAFDYYLRSWDSPECSTHHVVIVPDTCIGTNQKMNEDGKTDEGYYGSDMKTTNLNTAVSTITTAFGSTHLLKHKCLFANAATSGHESGFIWVESCVDLMNENMVYGTNIFRPRTNGAEVWPVYTVDKTQLPLFTFRPDLISNRLTYWLRDVVSATHFAVVYYYGNANAYTASALYGVRPAFTVS